jgi:hypothetical protein
MFPAQGREVPQQGVVYRVAVISEGLNRPLQICHVPQDDGRRKQDQTSGAVTLVFGAEVAHFPDPVEEHRAGERVAHLPFYSARH